MVKHVYFNKKKKGKKYVLKLLPLFAILQERAWPLTFLLTYLKKHTHILRNTGETTVGITIRSNQDERSLCVHLRLESSFHQ